MNIERELAALRAEVAESRRRVPARIGGNKAEADIRYVTQTGHGLSVMNAVRHDGTNWVKSKADSAANAVVGGIVSQVINADLFVLATAGYITGLSGLTAGAVHYLSAATAGLLTTTAPGVLAVSVLHADTASSGVMLGRYIPPAWGAGLIPTSRLGYVVTTGSGSLGAAPSDGTMLFLLNGAGAGGSTGATTGIIGYVAASSGGSPTTALHLARGGGGGGGGGWCIGAVKVSSGDTPTYSVGAGGARGNPGSDGGDTTMTVAGYTFRAEGGQGGGNIGVGSPDKRRGGHSNSVVNGELLMIASTHWYMKGAGDPGGDAAYTSCLSGTVLYGGAGGGGRDPSSSPSGSGGGYGEDWTVGTGGSNNHQAGADGMLAVGFIPD